MEKLICEDSGIGMERMKVEFTGSEDAHGEEEMKKEGSEGYRLGGRWCHQHGRHPDSPPSLSDWERGHSNRQACGMGQG